MPPHVHWHAISALSQAVCLRKRHSKLWYDSLLTASRGVTLLTCCAQDLCIEIMHLICVDHHTPSSNYVLHKCKKQLKLVGMVVHWSRQTRIVGIVIVCNMHPFTIFHVAVFLWKCRYTGCILPLYSYYSCLSTFFVLPSLLVSSISILV